MHFVQFDGHASRGPPKRRNVTDVTEILGKCRNHLGSRKNLKKGLKIPKKTVRSLFRSVYIYLVEF